jgi:hypothetical protein
MLPFLKTCKDKCAIALTPANIFIFINKSNHWFLAVLLVMMTPLEQRFLYLIDPTAAPIDAGIYSLLYTALIMAAVVLGFATLGQRINHNPMFDRLDNDTKVRAAFEETSLFKALCLSFLNFVFYVLTALVCLYCATQVAH